MRLLKNRGSQSSEKVIKSKTKRENGGVCLSLENHKATGLGEGHRLAGRERERLKRDWLGDISDLTNQK